MFSNFQPKLTVANVLVGFNRMIDDLKRVEEDSEAEAARQAQAIIDARTAHDAAATEAAAARDVSDKLLALITPALRRCQNEARIFNINEAA